MNLETSTIEEAAKSVLSHRLWYDVKLFVDDASSMPMSNDEKHAKVRQDIINVFGDVGSTMIDLAIKFGVLWLKSTTGVSIEIPDEQ